MQNTSFFNGDIRTYLTGNGIEYAYFVNEEGDVVEWAAKARGEARCIMLQEKSRGREINRKNLKAWY